MSARPQITPAILPVSPDYEQLGEVVLAELSPLQRIFLVADGTLTKLLEVSLGEQMQVVKLAEQVTTARQALTTLELAVGEPIIERSIFLQGKSSGRSWLYADSIIALNHLDSAFKEKLLQSHVPIGKLWIEHKTETYKEIISARREPAGPLGKHFQLGTDAVLLSRTYRVFCQQRPVMQITEKFPAHYFTSDWQ